MAFSGKESSSLLLFSAAAAASPLHLKYQVWDSIESSLVQVAMPAQNYFYEKKVGFCGGLFVLYLKQVSFVKLTHAGVWASAKRAKQAGLLLLTQLT